jgi:hypothetical protein
MRRRDRSVLPAMRCFPCMYSWPFDGTNVEMQPIALAGSKGLAGRSRPNDASNCGQTMVQVTFPV